MRNHAPNPTETGQQNDTEQLVLTQSKDGCSKTIKGLPPYEIYHTLGVWIAANGNQKGQLKVMQEKVGMWLKAIETNSLNDSDKHLVYSMFLRPQLAYPIGCTTIEAKDLRELSPCPQRYFTHNGVKSQLSPLRPTRWRQQSGASN